MRARLALAAMALLVLPTSAQATFPGRNGDLVASLEQGCDFGIDLVTLPWPSGEESKLTDACEGDGAHTFYSPEAAPDGQSLLLGTSTVPSHFASIPAAGGPITEVKVDGEVGTSSYAPDQESFLLEGTDEHSVVSVPLDGTASTTLFKVTCRKGKECPTVENPRWSPTGKELTVELARPNFEDTSPSAGLWIVNAKTGKLVRRLSSKGQDADWSPDGKRVVFVRRGDLVIIDRTGKHRRKLVARKKPRDTEPVFSPDGTRVAWVSLEIGKGDELFDVSAEVWTVMVKTGKRKRFNDVRDPEVEEGFYHAPELTWLPKP